MGRGRAGDRLPWRNDALPGLSQEAGVAEPRPMEAGGHGHGCGHNLLGSAALLAATSVKDWLAATPAAGARALLRLSRGRRRSGESLHGARGCSTTSISRSPGIPQFLGSGGYAIACQHPRRFHFHRAHRACRGLAASRPQRAGRSRTDECRRQLHARAHAERRPRALALLDAGGIPPNVVQAMPGCAIRSRPRPARHERTGGAGPQDRAGRGADDRNQSRDEDHFRRLQHPAQHAARAGAARDHGRTRPAAFRRGGQKFRQENPRNVEGQGYRVRLLRDRHGSRPTGRWPISSCRWTPGATR